jgi:hypothetical protein
MWRGVEQASAGCACATKPLSTRKKWLVLYAPSFARRMMCGAVTGATCAVRTQAVRLTFACTKYVSATS